MTQKTKREVNQGISKEVIQKESREIKRRRTNIKTRRQQKSKITTISAVFLSDFK